MKITFSDGTVVESTLPSIRIIRRTREVDYGGRKNQTEEEITYTEMVGP